MNNSPLDPTVDEPVDLPATLQYAKQLPEAVTSWWAINLQRMINQPHLDAYGIRQALPVMQNVTDLIESWARKGVLHKNDSNLKAVRYWWELFMHLYGERPMQG